jgi:hypothetical protein
MSSVGYKRALISLSVALASISAIAVWCGYLGLRQGVEAVLSDNRAMILDEMRESGIAHTNATEIAATLRSVERWYRGPTAEGGSSQALHNLMERVRAGVERDLIRHLREVTSEDLGEDPMPWIQKYATTERQ